MELLLDFFTTVYIFFIPLSEFYAFEYKIYFPFLSKLILCNFHNIGTTFCCC